jgi:rhamnosyltransferase
MMVIDVICPLYNAEQNLPGFMDRLFRQKNVSFGKLIFPVTQSDDKTLEIIRKYDVCSYEIKKEDFSHSLTREQAMKKAVSDVVVFMTQDVVLDDVNALYNLSSCIGKNNVVHAFAKQTTKSRGIEKYTREKNYPGKSYIVEKKDVERMQLKAFYSSDACAAYDREVFLNLGGFDGKRMQVSEDMYFAKKAIDNGFAIEYCAEAVVIHSHKFTIKQVYKRYYDIGVFFKQNPQFKKYKSSESGLSLAWYILGRALLQINIPVLIRFIPDMLARYFGKRDGERS